MSCPPLPLYFVTCIKLSRLYQSPPLPSQLYLRFSPLPRASRSVLAYIVYIFLASSSAFEAKLVGKSTSSLDIDFFKHSIAVNSLQRMPFESKINKNLSVLQTMRDFKICRLYVKPCYKACMTFSQGFGHLITQF